MATRTKNTAAQNKRRAAAEKKAAELAKELEKEEAKQAAPRERLPEAIPAFADQDGSYVVFVVDESDEKAWTLIGLTDGDDYTRVGRAAAEAADVSVDRIRVLNKRFVSAMTKPEPAATEGDDD